MSAVPNRAGMAATLAVIALALLLFALVLLRVDANPRTHVASLYADTTALAPDVSGRIVAIHVRDNQAVRAGELLVEIDPEPYALRVRGTLAVGGTRSADKPGRAPGSLARFRCTSRADERGACEDAAEVGG